MDGRKLIWLGGLIAGAALGCNRAERVPTDPYSASPVSSVAPGEKTSSKRPLQNRRAKEIEPVAESKGKSAAGKPINMVRVADAQSAAAADDSATAEQRQSSLTLARQNYARALKLDPKFVAAHLGLARACSRAGEQEQAVRTLDAALAKLPKEAPLWHERGMVMGRMKQHDEALANLQQAATLDPSTAAYAKSVGMMLARQGNAEGAVPWLRKSMNEADARYNVARMMRHVGDEGESHRQLQLALRADPEHPASLAMSDEGKSPAAQPVKLASHNDEPAPVPEAIHPASPPMRIIVDAPAAPPATALPQRPVAPERRAAPMMPVVSEQWEQKPAVPASLEGPRPAARKDPRGRPAVQIGFEPNN